MHTHVVEMVLREAASISRRPLRVLDVGCGDGRLLVRIHQELRDHGIDVAPYGLDVDDRMVQEPNFIAAARRRLSEQLPDVDWPVHLSVIGSEAAWPFPPGAFDVIVSNQVGEHVTDLARLFKECARVIDDHGVSVHVFPLEQYTIEGHSGVPLAHRVLSADVREAYMRVFATIGASRLGPLRKRPAESPAVFAATRSDYVSRQTTYRTWKSVARAAAAAGLSPSYRYTVGPYLIKLLGRSAAVTRWYYRQTHPWIDAALFRPLSRASSITVFLRREDRFDPTLNATSGASHV